MRLSKAIQGTILAGALLGAPTSIAAPIGQAWQIGNWILGAYSLDPSPDFALCTATSQYRSGIELSFSFSRDLQWAIALTNTQWTLTPRAAYTVQLSIDDAALGQVPLTAMTETMVGSVLPADAELFQRMRRGQRLWVKAVGQEFNFELRDSARVLNDLVDCANRHRQVASSNPFVAPPKDAAGGAPPTPPPSSGPIAPGRAVAPPTTAERQAAEEWLGALVSLGAFPGAQPLAREQFPKNFQDRIAVWRGTDTMGTMHLVRPQEAADADEIARPLIAEAAANCNDGIFASGSVPDPEIKVRRVFTGCEDKQRPFYWRYFIMPNGKGGHYVISTYGFDRPEPAQQAEDHLRDVVVEFIRRALESGGR